LHNAQITYNTSVMTMNLTICTGNKNDHETRKKEIERECEYASLPYSEYDSGNIYIIPYFMHTVAC